MKHTLTLGTAALLVLLAAPATAQDSPDNNDSAQRFDRERGELSPGTHAPTRDDMMAVIESGTPQRLFGMLEYGERVECHSCVPLLQRRLLADADPRVREIAAWWLRRRPFGFAAVYREVRLALENDADPVRRARAAEALGEFMDPHGIVHLTAALEDTDAGVRAAAVRGLGRINAPGQHAGIVQAFSDPDPAVREAAIQQVLRVNQFRDHDALIGLLADDTVAVRRRTALTIGTFRVSSAVPALAAMLAADEDPNVRQAAAWALGRIGGGEARTALTAQRGTEENARVRDAIEIALRM